MSGVSSDAEILYCMTKWSDSKVYLKFELICNKINIWHFISEMKEIIALSVLYLLCLWKTSVWDKVFKSVYLNYTESCKELLTAQNQCVLRNVVLIKCFHQDICWGLDLVLHLATSECCGSFNILKKFQGCHVMLGGRLEGAEYR